MTCRRIRHASIFCFHSFCFTLTKLKIKYLEPHTFTLTPRAPHPVTHSYPDLSSSWFATNQPSLLRCPLFYGLQSDCRLLPRCSLCWPVMIHVGLVLCAGGSVALQTGTVGIQPKRWLQRCTSAQSSNEATTSKTHKLQEVIPLCERIAASWASVAFYRSCCLIVIYPSFGFLLLYSWFSQILFQPVHFDKYLAKWQQTFLNLEVFTWMQNTKSETKQNITDGFRNNNDAGQEAARKWDTGEDNVTHGK